MPRLRNGKRKAGLDFGTAGNTAQQKHCGEVQTCAGGDLQACLCIRVEVVEQRQANQRCEVREGTGKS